MKWTCADCSPTKTEAQSIPCPACCGFVGEACMVSDCGQPAVELTANYAAYLSAEYSERWVCRWHRSNPFPLALAGANTDES